MKVHQSVSAASTLLLALAPAGASRSKAGKRSKSSPSPACAGALALLRLTEPFDTDAFVGANEDAPVPGDAYAWGGNRLCPGADAPDCAEADAVGRAYGASTYVPGEETFMTTEHWVLGAFGTLTVSSVEFPGATPLGAVTGGTGCFAGASGQTTATLAGDNVEYYNYDLSKVVLA